MKGDYNNITLYHGSDVVVDKPLLNKCNEGKDFGKGFYLSFNFKQAVNFSKIIKRRNGGKHSIVTEFILDDLNDLSVYEFVDANEEWLDCIINYRYSQKKNSKWDKYDVLIGKIADDDTSRTINAYMSGAYGKLGSKKAISFAISMFKTSRLEKQICFRTNKALKHIRFNRFHEDES